VTAPANLTRLIAAELAQPISAGAHALTAQLRERYGAAVRGVLFYGSCLRGGDDVDGVLDLYLLVDTYRSVYRNPALAILNHLLPPNVFYLEAAVGDRVVRAKYAVLTVRDLRRFTAAQTFEPYFWARFAQPCALVYAANEHVQRDVITALANAVVTMVGRGVPLVAPRFDSRTLWTTTWRATYRTELRSERPDVIAALWAYAPERYVQATQWVLESLPYPIRSERVGSEPVWTVRLPRHVRRGTHLLWHLRRINGKTRFLLRMLRNALIFEGGVDYVLWKIQRHSGIDTATAWRQHRYPLLALGAHAWRLYRAGAFR
jgi:hypothetical protein